jgi:glycosyltransferase involved in cell wall biosynthesis
MLELVKDNRSGSRLEVVTFTFNEEKRIGNLLHYYGGRFDIVVLDGGSTDRTVAMALEMNATVFKRLGDQVGESYFAYYTNELTQSGICFYLLVDEFIEKSLLERIEEELQEGVSGALCRKAEWIYGRRMRTLDHIEPRGFRRGSACYAARLHSSLDFTPSSTISQHIFEFHHLHIGSAQSSFGKLGLYSSIEIAQIRKSRWALWRFCRRYLLILISFPVLKVWREPGIGLPRALYFFFSQLAIAAVSASIWIEQRFLMSSEELLAQYSRLYTDDPTDQPTQSSR